jgi:hypothetical protein
MASTTPVRRPWTAVVQRWPTALALGTATLILDDVRSDAGWRPWPASSCCCHWST